MTRIVMSMGDPAGIGPEIICRAISDPRVSAMAEITVIGDLAPIIRAKKITGIFNPIRLVNNLSEKTPKGVIRLMNLNLLRPDDTPLGLETPKGGLASYAYVIRGIELALKKKADALVTAPVNKHALHIAGINYPGHTEILAEETKIKNFGMMLMCEQLKVMLVTTHTSLKSVPGLLTIKKVQEKIELAHSAMKNDFGKKSPRVAVLGLNPHAGEAGAFGDEEQRIIIPAIKNAVKKGIKAEGPFPPDTIFGRIVKNKSHDIAVCMYHDQGLIPLKLLGFETGVNVTLGLPIVRTSPDHGTAYDIAGTGKASPESLVSAIKAAVLISRNRKK